MIIAMGCNGIEHLCKEVVEDEKGLRKMDDDKLVSVRGEIMSQEDDGSPSSKERGSQSTEVTSLPHRGLCSFALSKSDLFSVQHMLVFVSYPVFVSLFHR